MDHDIILIILLCLFFVFCLIRRIRYDREKARNDRGRLHKEEPYVTKLYEIRFIYGFMLTLIVGCLAYLYFRLSGRLENIFPYIFEYYGL